LTAPDPSFLDVVGEAPFAIVPSSAPWHNVGEHPLPATGPYEIASFKEGGEVDLVRNDDFRAWSPVAQPPGFADRITIELGVPTDEGTARVESGDADLLLDAPAPRELSKIQTRYSAQIHPFAQLGVLYVFMNVNEPPFDDVDVRRAVNFAID